MTIRTLAAGTLAALLAVTLTAPALGAMADDTAVDPALDTVVTEDAASSAAADPLAEPVERPTTVDPVAEEPIETPPDPIDVPVETPPAEIPSAETPLEEPTETPIAPTDDSASEELPADGAPIDDSGIDAHEVHEAPEAPEAPTEAGIQFGPVTPAVIPSGYVHDQVVHVTDDSGNPVLASVALLRTDGTERMRVDTDAQGVAHLMYVSIDDYTVRVTPNYAVHGDLDPEWYEDASSFAEADFFSVVPSLGPLSVVLESDPAAPSGSIAGTVTDAATGAPLQFAELRLTLASDTSDTIRVLTTGADGTYSMSALPPEEYRLTFSAPGYTDWVTWVNIGSGAATVDAELEVDPQYGYPHATGLVTDYEGRLLRNAIVEFYTDVDGSPVASATTVSGMYALLFSPNGTDPGSYYVRFVAPALSDLESVWWPGVENAADATAYSFTTAGQHRLSMSLPKEPEPPVPHDDYYAVSQDLALVVPEPSGGPLANDTGEPPLSLDHVSGPSYGSISIQEDGTFTYMPDTGFVGVDVITYRAFDSLGQGSAGYGSIYIAVGEISDAPAQANDDHYSVMVGDTLELDAAHGPLANDTGAPILVFGELDDKDDIFREGVGDYDYSDDGSLTFEPRAGVVGSHSVEYSMEDGYGRGSVGTITITIVDPDAPADDPTTGVYSEPFAGSDGLAHTGSGVPVGIIATALVTILGGAWLLRRHGRSLRARA